MISETAIELANRIEHRIRAANLLPGTLFKKTAAIAKEYGVSTSCANLAMRLLVQRRLVERRPRAGTVIADYHSTSPSPLDKIHFMMPHTAFDVPPELLNDMLLGVQSIFPRAEIGFIYYQDAEGSGGEAELKELIKGAADHALILVRAPLSLQRLVGESGLPCIVLGHPFPTVSLPWVDADSARQGVLAASCILDHPEASALTLMHNRIAPGDYLFMEGMKKQLLRNNWDLCMLTERFVPSDAKVIEHTVKEYLLKNKNPCTIIISTTIADLVLKTIKQLKATGRVSVISIRSINCKLQSTAKSTLIDWEIDLYELGVKLGELLLDRITNGKKSSQKTVFQPRIVSVK